jgi:dTDP-4-dehydrorhamnose reductase
MPVIVVGGDSAVGDAFARALRQRGEAAVVTSRRRQNAESRTWPLDLADPEIATAALPEGEIAFFCAAINGFSSCCADPVRARQVNVEGTAVVARRLAARGTRVVLLSSSAVFDFRTPRRRPGAPTNPRTVYGQLKAEAERLFLSLGPLGAVLRIGKVLAPNAALFTGWISALARGSTITAFSDLHFSPITLDDAVAALFGVRSEASGDIFQFTGTDDISYAAAARHLAARMRMSPARVEVELAAARGIPAEEIARFTSLDSSRLQAITGRIPPEPFAVLDAVYGPVIAAAEERARGVG